MKIFKAAFRIVSKYGWATTLVILAGFAVGFTWSSSEDLYSSIRIFDRAAVTISSEYVENLNESEMIKAGIDGMLSKLDPYSKFLTGADFLYLMQETDGQFEGIGVTLGIHSDSLTVESVLEGSPGYNRGLKSGDRIIAIDGLLTNRLDIKDIKMKLRGPRGSHVRLQIVRPGGNTFELNLERDKVEIKPITYYGMASGEIGYIRLARFSDGCSKDLRSAIKDLKKLGMKSLILDLRDNPGGLLIESVNIASLFLPKGLEITQTRGKNGIIGNTYFSTGESDFQNGGLAILVDGQTASAAEIVAGAIQDHDHGVIIGVSTYGKGLVQQVVQFSDESALKITTAKYYLPSGRCLQKPDWSTFELVAGPIDKPTDSLFSTASGRLVIGGGGIIPDIFVDIAEPSPYVDALMQQSCFFDFAINYIQSHTITPTFKITDSIMVDFRQYLNSKKFQYVDDERAALKSLKLKIKSPNEAINGALNTIDKEIAAKEAWNFESNYLEISEKLREAIVLEVYGETAVYRDIWIPSQTEISEAINVLSDSNRYTDILTLH
jgi:carboxyl-terminal processing protease